MNEWELPLTRLSLIGFLRNAGPEDNRSGDPAREEFYRAYHPVILRWCLRHGLQQADAEDVGQSLALKLFEKVRTYRPEMGRFRVWLRTVVRNSVADFKRGENGRPHLLPDSMLESLRTEDSLTDLENEVDRVRHPDEELAREVIARARQRVQPHTWDAFFRFKIEGQAAREVAEDLGITVNSLHVAAIRVVKILREEREKLLNERPGERGIEP